MSISEQLESAIDIKDLVSKYITLKKSGVNYKAVCPFPWHNEKTPSFMVSPSKQIAYCFGCHKWWGPIKFIMDIENCDFKEAIEILGSMTGIAVNTNFNHEKHKERKSLYSLFKDAVYYYKNTLTNYPDVKKYLFERGITTEIIDKFHFWYSDSWVELFSYLKNKWYDEQLIISSNIFLDINSKKDKFINRIIFPIQNARWDFVALAGRILGSWEPKYLNSPASDIYDKSNILYGLFEARTQISKLDYVIICEWYMDVIALQSHGFFNSVWVSWTALTDKHLQLLKRLTKKIYLCFDGDNAWEKATKASLEKMKNQEFEVKVILLPNGKDPDEIIKSWGDFHQYIKNACSPVAYYIRKTQINTSSIDDKKRILWELLEMIKSYSNNIEKDHYLKEVSSILNINENIIYDAFNKIRFKINTTHNAQIKSEKIDSEELVMAHCILDNTRSEFFAKNLIFHEYISKDLSNILKNPSETLQSFEIEKKERIKAFALKIENNETLANADNQEEELKKTAYALNKEIYKKQVEVLKNKMNHGDDESFIHYSQLVALAKKHGIK